MNTIKTKSELQAELGALILEKEVIIANNNLVVKRRAVEDKRALTLIQNKESEIVKLTAVITAMPEDNA